MIQKSKRVEHVSEKWEMVTNHMARRSFAPKAHKAGIAPFAIMQITGHKSQKTFNYSLFGFHFD